MTSDLNIIGNFVDDCIEKDEQSYILIDDTYQMFRNWWKESGGIGKVPIRRLMKQVVEQKLGICASKSRWEGYKLVPYVIPEDSSTGNRVAVLPELAEYDTIKTGIIMHLTGTCRPI